LLEKTVALSGGKTYSSLFPFWIKLKPDCTNTSFFPVDERIVPFDDPGSNWGTTFKNFLQLIGNARDKDNFMTSPEMYRKILFQKFQQDVPVFDVIFLGVGDDGHTASLFPNTDDCKDLSSPVLQTRSPKPPFNRITLSIKVLMRAKTLITVIRGIEKKNIVKKLEQADTSLPIVQVLMQCNRSKIFIEDKIL
jgi:6-phosphogluconolactonase